jgi:hypothetical protein
LGRKHTRETHQRLLMWFILLRHLPDAVFG